MNRPINLIAFGEIVDSLAKIHGLSVQDLAGMLSLDEWKLTKKLKGELDFTDEEAFLLGVSFKFEDSRYFVELKARCL